jgi:hypothetical protein
LRDVAREETLVEGAVMFGDRIHLRLRRRMKKKEMSRLKRAIIKADGVITQLRPIPPMMEDVFIAFVQSEADTLIQPEVDH